MKERRPLVFWKKKQKEKMSYVCNNRILIVPNNPYSRMETQARDMGEPGVCYFYVGDVFTHTS